MRNATYYNWKAKCSDVSVSDLRGLKAMEAGNRRLKQMAADQALDNLALKEKCALVKTSNARG